MTALPIEERIRAAILKIMRTHPMRELRLPSGKEFAAAVMEAIGPEIAQADREAVAVEARRAFIAGWNRAHTMTGNHSESAWRDYWSANFAPWATPVQRADQSSAQQAAEREPGCDCQQPPTHVSESCPVHNDYPVAFDAEGNEVDTAAPAAGSCQEN